MAGTSWPTLAAGRKASAAEVNAHFAWIEGSLIPFSGGSSTDGVYDIGTTTAYWRVLYCNSINATSTAHGVAIGTTTVANNSDVALEVAAAKTVLLTRITTTQRNALTPINGMIHYNTTVPQFEGYQGGVWTAIAGNIKQQFTASFQVNGSSLTPVGTLTSHATIVPSNTVVSFYASNFWSDGSGNIQISPVPIIDLSTTSTRITVSPLQAGAGFGTGAGTLILRYTEFF